MAHNFICLYTKAVGGRESSENEREREREFNENGNVTCLQFRGKYRRRGQFIFD